jgi:hypothetical protein
MIHPTKSSTPWQAEGRTIPVTAGRLPTFARVNVQTIAIDNSGSLYITGYGRLRKVSSGGTITTVAGNGN